MAAFKTESNKTWYVMVRYTDWKGERKQKCKRGFLTRAKALEWEREFLQQVRSDVDMTFDTKTKRYRYTKGRQPDIIQASIKKSGGTYGAKER